MKKTRFIGLNLKVKLALCFLLFFCCGILQAQESKSLDSLKLELKSAKEDTNKVDLLYKISRSYILRDVSKQKPYIKDMLELSIKLSYYRGIGRAYVSYADHYLRVNSPEKAFPYLLQADSLCQEGKYNAGIPVVNNLFGIYYKDKGDYERALLKYQKALSYYNENGNEKHQAITLSVISNLFYTMKRYDESEEYRLQAIDIFRRLDEPQSESVELTNLGLQLLIVEKYNKAEKYLNLSLKIQEEFQNKYVISRSLRGLGEVYNSKGMYQDALETLEKSYLILSSIPDTLEMSYTRKAQADVFKEMNAYDSSIVYMNEATSLARFVKADSVKMNDFYTFYYNLYKKMGSYEKALKYFERVIENRDKFFSKETDAKISELKEKYESTQKEQELELMRQKERLSTLEIQEKETEIRERTYLLIVFGILLILIIIWTYYLRKQKTLKFDKQSAQLEHKALRSQMNPHFIFNSLNSIQRMYVEGSTDEANEFLSEFSGLIRSILENSNHSKIALNEEINTLRAYLELEKLRTKDKFDFTIHVDDSIDRFNYQVPPLVLQPFVENAIWHGVLPGDKKGDIAINLLKDGDRVHVEIIDNGVGFNSESDKEHESQGIKITEKRIGSKVNIQSSTEGTKIDFTI
ncbi:MAG: tetratricopeptide repeat protein [Brumimicrobium sp.]